MKPLLTWIDRNKNKIWFSLGLQLFILGLLLIFMEPGFENSLRRETLPGALTEAVSFQNGLLRAFYQTVYGFCGSLPWYTLLQVLLLLLAFSAVTCVILRNIERRQGLFVVLVMMAFFGYECYIRMQYTKTAAVLSAASFFLIIYGSEKKEDQMKSLVPGVLLGSFGFLYSNTQFLICALLMIWFGAVWLLRKEKKKSGGERNRKSIIIYLGTLGVMAVLISGFWKADQMMYARTQQWQMDREKYTLREHLRDYGFPEYEQNKERYENLGISEKDLKQYQKKGKNQKQDPLEELSVDTMKTLAEAKPRERLSKALILLFLNRFSILWFQSGTFICFLLLAVFWIFLEKHDRGTFIMLLAEGVLTGAMYFCMFYRERNSCSEMDLGFWFALCLVLCLCITGKSWRLSGKMKALFLVTVLILNQSRWYSSWRLPPKTAKEKAKQEKYVGPFGLVEGAFELPEE